jgi:hypothetical protein
MELTRAFLQLSVSNEPKDDRDTAYSISKVDYSKNVISFVSVWLCSHGLICRLTWDPNQGGGLVCITFINV